MNIDIEKLIAIVHKAKPIIMDEYSSHQDILTSNGLIHKELQSYLYI